jgi:hypothetical protein
MEEFAEDEAIIAAGPSPQNSSDDSDESDDGRSDLSMSHYDSHIERLVEELETGDACVKEEAAIGLYMLTHDDANLAAIAAAGAIPPLLALRGQEWVASTLKNLAQDDTICTAIAEALVELARSGETEGQESAAAALRDLFYEFATEIAAAAGGVEALVVALVTKARPTARMLARSNRVAIKKLLVLRALVTGGRAETTSRTAPSIKWLLGAGSLALPNELIREILKFWRATPIRAWYPS